MIPIRAECDYCTQNTSHGGDCYQRKKTSTSIPCLGFKQDSRGKIEYINDQEMIFAISEDFPIIGKWMDGYTFDEKATPVKFTKITPIAWITKHSVAIKCKVSFDYYDNGAYDNHGEKTLAVVLQIKPKGEDDG